MENPSEFDARGYKALLEKTESIEAVRKVPVPELGNDSYVFISYSHKDYKAAYSDLAELYQAGVRFWYDRGLTPGVKWKAEVAEKLRDPRCVGVIFYMSRNLFKSDSVFYEISSTVPETEAADQDRIGKPHFSVNLESTLPAQTIFAAASELASDKNVNDIVSKLPKLVNAFPNEETYISYSSKTHVHEIIERLKDFGVISKTVPDETTISVEDISEGTLLNERYRILYKIGEGGMGTTYLADDLNLGSRCVAKIVEYGCYGDEHTSLVRESVKQECRLLKTFNHPGVLRVTDLLTIDNGTVIIMDYIEGASLYRLLCEQGPQSEETVIEWAKQLGSILNYLHSRKPPVVYRDMKPSNIIQTPEGTLKLIDFGTAMEYCEGAWDDICLGTPGYAAPEQYRGRSDRRSDIYALGVTLFQLLTGRDVQKSPIVPIRRVRPELSYKLEQIIQKCTQQNAENRYQNVDAILADLYQLKIHGKPSAAWWDQWKNKLRSFADGRMKPKPTPGFAESEETTILTISMLTKTEIPGLPDDQPSEITELLDE